MALEVEELAIGGWGGAPPLQRGVTLTVEEGARVSVAGPSGCGKTTLLRAIATLDDAVEGALRLDGRSPEDVGYPAWRSAVTYVHQRPSFFGGTVEEELRRPFSYAASRTRFDEAAARDALDALGLAAKWSAPTSELSQGEAQRVALLRAALPGPQVLLLDEPTSALDQANAEGVEAWLAGRPVAIVLVSHDVTQRERFTDEVVELDAPGSGAREVEDE